MNICIDIDGTITHAYYWVKYINKHFKTNLKEEDMIYYNLEKVANVTAEEFGEFYRIYSEEIHKNAVIREHAKNVLDELAKSHNIFYVTARDESLRDITLNWFKEMELPEGNLYMLGSHDKVNKAKELNCDLFLEDRYENAIDLSNNGIKILLIDCYYNRHPLNENIKRVADWNEISEYVKQNTREEVSA